MSFRVAISGFLCAVGVSVAAACVWAKTPASLPSTQEANPELAKQFLDAGKIALDKSQAPQAIEALNRSIQNDPDTLEAYLLLGKAYSLANDPCRAVANHRLALQLATELEAAQKDLEMRAIRDDGQCDLIANLRQQLADKTRECEELEEKIKSDNKAALETWFPARWKPTMNDTTNNQETNNERKEVRL